MDSKLQNPQNDLEQRIKDHGLQHQIEKLEDMEIEEFGTSFDSYIALHSEWFEGLETDFAEFFGTDGEVEALEFITQYYPQHSIPAHTVERRRQRKNNKKICYTDDVWPWTYYEYPDWEDLPPDNFMHWQMSRISRRTLSVEDDPVPVRHLMEGGSDVIVYVVDTGINPHSSFGNRLYPMYNHFDTEYIKDQVLMPSQDAGDGVGHGTLVAAAAAGSELGVAINSEIRNVKVFDKAGWGTSYTIFKGLFSIYEEVVTENRKRKKKRDDRKRVVVLSLSGPPSDAIDALLIELYNLDVVVVAAAGNVDDSGNMDACASTPQRNPTVITVGSVDASDLQSAWSKRGSCVDILAPGEKIVTASHTDASGFIEVSGTSFSAPIVAGVMASLWSKQRLLTARQVKSVLIAASTPGEINMGPNDGTPNLLLFAPISVKSLKIQKGGVLEELSAFDVLLGDTIHWDQVFSLKRKRYHRGSMVDWLEDGLNFKKNMYVSWLAGRVDTPALFFEWLETQTDTWGLGPLAEWLSERRYHGSSYSIERRRWRGRRRATDLEVSEFQVTHGAYVGGAFDSYVENARTWAEGAYSAWQSAKDLGQTISGFRQWMLEGYFPGSNLYSAFVSATERSRHVGSTATIHFDDKGRNILLWAGNAILIYDRQGNAFVEHLQGEVSFISRQEALPGQLPMHADVFAQSVGNPNIRMWDESSEFGLVDGQGWVYSRRKRHSGR
ncbi:hypothetical protein SARC_06071 [Sphaeroforma arctica JP610]|uniref:Peptidase S8/S53 domain-containing protein n=1 Tax=Sphaeroforma arctica JP610 TaxID=667725 RepID=A0A0L0FXR4_9EUKA|nr:hypothetical protein SARC_06071 [Sphaeroforma arctica JP610]KNC81615.1 hypothetical protein SARC_06071 [Sphaeroforma arctica JP610]|eukprot:XP_014155517.1 hypothetical protein SARC_06071 [Sphaeroforma arctica JP610]